MLHFIFAVWWTGVISIIVGGTDGKDCWFNHDLVSALMKRKNQLILNLRMKCSRQSVTEENVASRMRQAHPPLELSLSIDRGHNVRVSHCLSFPTLHETSMMQFSDSWPLKF